MCSRLSLKGSGSVKFLGLDVVALVTPADDQIIPSVKQLYLEQRTKSPFFEGNSSWLSLRKATLSSCTSDALRSVSGTFPLLQELLLKGKFTDREGEQMERVWVKCSKRLRVVDVSQM